MVAGGLGFMYNLPGDPPLKLDADTACGIFTGEITNWDDSNLAALNPGVTLQIFDHAGVAWRPGRHQLRISTVVHR